MKNIHLLKDGLQQLSIDVTQEMLEKFETYFELLIHWNTMINLTSIVEEEEVIVKHFLDSLLVVKALDMKSINSLLDVGTGAGFPGIPLKIIYPHIQLVLLDSVNKKVKFLQEVCQQLSLLDVKCLHGRAEDFAQQVQYREKFDCVVSRAVSNLSTLSEYCIPFVQLTGYFISYKSSDYELEVEDALNAIEVLGGTIEKIVSLKIPHSDITRTYVLILKSIRTQNHYPRKAGLPSKKPL